jgi:ATP-dependent protease HslVU (ClpYQ) peptidase subunit
MAHSLFINIDADASGTDAKLVVAKDDTGEDGTVLFQINEDGSVFGGVGELEVVTAANVITAAESGKTFVLNSATAFASTLPAVAAGLEFTFVAGATQVTGGNHTIVPNAANDNTIYGEYLVAGLTVPASAEGSINWVADTILPGDRVHVVCDGTNWYVDGAAAASGAITFTT